MTKEERVRGFQQLKEALLLLGTADKEELMVATAAVNPWFTETNISLALEGVLVYLEPESLVQWLDSYDLPGEQKRIGIVMAGNIPLVGFHDFLSVILAGHIAVIKLSSQDKVLIQFIIDRLLEINPAFGNQIDIVDKLPKVDAVIATGSDNSSRYFKKYFKDIPHIIRKNRTSVAILNGRENADELKILGKDIFSFFGLGCRNVAKIYIPKGYDITKLLDALEGYQEVINHPKYFNNYEYNKAIYLVNRVEHLDTGYVLFTKDEEVSSPLAVVYYEEYNSMEELEVKLEDFSEKLQCIIAGFEFNSIATIPFGKAQLPEIDDFADNVDTMAFLCQLS